MAAFRTSFKYSIVQRYISPRISPSELINAIYKSLKTPGPMRLHLITKMIYICSKSFIEVKIESRN